MTIAPISTRTGCSNERAGQSGWAFVLVGAFMLVSFPAGDAKAQSPNTPPASVGTDGEQTSRPNAESLEEDVLDWVEQLGASTLQQRKSAENQLIATGPKVLKFLPPSDDGLSAEVIDRIKRVREQLIEHRTLQEAKDDIIQVRLSDVANLGEALEAISRDSGIEFEHTADLTLPIRAVRAPLSFWHAVDLVLDEANLDINFYGGDQGTLLLIPRAPNRPSRVDSAAYTGVYRLEPTMVSSRKSLNQPELSALNINIEIAWEPRLTPIGLTIPIKQLAGQLDDDARLQPQGSGHHIEIATNADLAFSEFFLPMQLPAGQPSKINSLSGAVRAMLPGKQKDFEMPLQEAGTPKKIDSMTVNVEEIRKNGPLHELRVSIQLEDADRSLESHRHWIFENNVYVRRADGSRADHLGYEVYRQSKSGVGIGYLFDLGDAVSSSTLMYRSPTVVMRNEVSFVIQDIELP